MIGELVKKLAAGAVIAIAQLKVLLAIYGFIVIGNKHFFSQLVIAMGKRAL